MHLITLVNYYCTCWGFAIDQLVLEYLLHRCVTLIKQMWLHTYQFLFGFKAQNLKVMLLAELCSAVLAPRNIVRGTLLRERRVPATLRGKLQPQVGFCHCVSTIEWTQERNKQTSSESSLHINFSLSYAEMRDCVHGELIRKLIQIEKGNCFWIDVWLNGPDGIYHEVRGKRGQF